MSNALFLKVLLDEIRPIRFDTLAEYKMGSLDRPFSVTDLNKPKKRKAALIAWVWACLYEPHPFEDPEQLAKIITAEMVLTLFPQVVECITMGLPNGKKDEKNGSAESAPSPASNSA